MSLYHETASILSGSPLDGASLRTRVFGQKGLKSGPAQVYALALETCKWSKVLQEVVDNAQLLKAEKKLSPILSLLLVHDFLLAKDGIALPAAHGLRASVERHKARLASEFTRARIRRKAASVEALKAQVDAASAFASGHPRWVRINAIKSSLDDQLRTTFSSFTRVHAIADILLAGSKLLYVDENVPDLVAVSPGTDLTKTDAYKSGAIILQDKASCFPAYLLDPRPEDGDLVDSCAAPGNKTTHLAAMLLSANATASRKAGGRRIFAFEKDAGRSKTLREMVKAAGCDSFTHVSPATDFLKVDPRDAAYGRVGAILLDPSCSGSGIVGRHAIPELHLPQSPSSGERHKTAENPGRKRKREEPDNEKRILVDDDGQATVVASQNDLRARLDALSSFQLALVLHAFKFAAATKVTYSTCSIHAEENEGVVLRALRSEIARERGWRILERSAQVQGMQEWPVRGDVDASEGDERIADACIRAHMGDGRGVMGFFVAGFVRGTDKAELRAPRRHSESGGGEHSAAEHGRDVRDDASEWGGFSD